MMNYRQLYLGFAALLAASCTQEIELEETVARSPYEKVQITAGTPMTRMTAEKDGKLTHFNWNRGDMIALATSEQQLPYITHNDGSTATFLSALGSSASKDDYLYDKEGSVVYARYPYKDTQPVDMETLTTPVSLGTPLLYAVDTLQDGKLDLHFHHAMAYLRFHVQHDILRTEDSISTRFEMSFDYERDRFPISGQFDYKTKSIQPTDSTWRWQLPLSLLSDTVSLYPIFPFKSNRKFVFELGQEDVSMPETNTDAYYYSKSVLKDLPSGGLQAGHVYDVYLDFRKYITFTPYDFSVNWDSDFNDFSQTTARFNVPASGGEITVFYTSNAQSSDELGLTIFYNVNGEPGDNWSGQPQYADVDGDDTIAMYIRDFHSEPTSEGSEGSITFIIPPNPSNENRSQIYGVVSGINNILFYKLEINQSANSDSDDMPTESEQGNPDIEDNE